MNTHPAACRLSSVASRHRRFLTAALLGVFAASLAPVSSHAQSTSVVPSYLSYQGQVTNANGTLVGAGTPVQRKVRFRVWTSAAGTTAAELLYSEEQTATIVDGEFSLLIGAGGQVATEPTKGPPNVSIADVFNGTARYLGVAVEDSAGAITEISPRQQIVTSAFAFRAKFAESVGVNGASSLTALNNGNIGIGNPTPGQKLDVAGSIRATNGLLASGTNGYGFHSGDTDGGIFSPADGVLTFNTNAAERVRIDGSGNVIAQTGSMFAGGYSFRSPGDADGGVFSPADNVVTIRTNNAERVRVTASASVPLVGIGTATPAFPLSFADANGDKISLYGQSTGASYGFGISTNLLQIHSSDSNSDIAFGYGSSASMTERMRIKGTGSVGIGTNAPSDKLHVKDGNIRVQGGNAALMIADSDNTVRGNVAVALAASNYSADAVAGDIVLRAEANGKLLLQSGAGNAAIAIGSDNKVKVNNFVGGIRSEGNRGSHEQGAHLEWNKGNGDGKTYLLNQSGNGVGGIVFGEVNTANTMTETMRISSAGKLDIVSGSTTLQILPGQLFATANAAAATLEIPGVNTIGIWDNLAVEGRVGIGTSSPNAPLHVATWTNITNNINRYMDGSSHGGAVSNFGGDYSISADRRVRSSQAFDVVSDQRMKTILGRSDSAADFAMLMQLEVTDYKFKDTIDKSDRPEKKVIAQQVETIYPQAVNRTTDVVPDIFEKAVVRDGWIELATTLRVGERVRLLTSAENGVYDVLAVEPGRFRTNLATAADQLFVYGREVNDLRVVDYDALAMLNISATQELKREKDGEVKALRDENAALRARLAEQESRLAAIEQRLRVADTAMARPAALPANGQE